MTQIYRFKDLYDAKAFTKSLRGNRDMVCRRLENRVEILSDIDSNLLKVLSVHYSGSSANGKTETDN